MLEKVKAFSDFIGEDIQAALVELSKINIDASRIHLQRLVFTNLVDRFDFTLDGALIDLVRTNDSLQKELAAMLTDPVSQGDFIQRIMADKDFNGVQESAIGQLEDVLTNDLARKRHSLKLRKLMTLTSFNDKEFLGPRINWADGHIHSKAKQGTGKMPISIIGYADWLYSKRNAIIHGGDARKILPKDEDYLKKNFGWTPTSGMRIVLSTIKNVANFYTDLTSMITARVESEKTK